MNPHDENEREEFRALLKSLGEVWGEAVSAERGLLYFGALADHSIDAVRAAILVAIKTKTFFPKPAELRQIIEGSSDDRALTAWTRVETAIKSLGTYQSVTFDDPILHATLWQMGGWGNAWAWDRLDERDYGFKRLEFTRLYGHFLRVGAPRVIAYLAGQHESENRERQAMWTHALEHADEIHRIGDVGESVGILASTERRALQGDIRPLALTAPVVLALAARP
jgi:uncharacterized protein (DUF736 family)